MPLLLITGPSGAGPGERERMLDAASEHLRQLGLESPQVLRIDVPGRGAGEEGDGLLRKELEPAIPLLQSGSLFGEQQGLQLVDAQNLQKAELEALLPLLDGADLELTDVTLVWFGSPPKAVAELAKHRGRIHAVKKMWERQVAEWAASELEARSIEAGGGAVAALVRHFGTDTAGMGRAMDQLRGVRGKVTAATVDERFSNRPDEPPWHITDAIGRGEVGGALRRLGDFLVHGHPLVYLATLETEVKRRSMAAAAPDLETFKSWVGSGSDRQLKRYWANRGRAKESSLRLAQEALVRADRVLKTEPEEIHRVTLERLTVAMCRWLG